MLHTNAGEADGINGTNKVNEANNTYLEEGITIGANFLWQLLGL